MTQYPLKHISIRVPWHDNGWNGTVCTKPCFNDSCLKLPRIAENRNENAENGIAGKTIDDIDEKQWPPCVSERGMFMSPFNFTRHAHHPYADTSPDTHGHFQSTPLYHPAYSAPAVPFLWMRSENMEHYALQYNLDVDPDREPKLKFKTGWVQEKSNQTALLNCFAEHIQEEKSLCFFYAKRVPFVEEDYGRILIGVGRVSKIGELTPYKQDRDSDHKLQCVLWERMISHSIRPNYKDGFILPYYDILEYAKKDMEFNPADLAVFAPADRILEFSYASEHVSHDAAISSLLECASMLKKADKYLEGSRDTLIQWIDRRIAELWNMRGPCPGLGPALTAFGVELGTLVARDIAGKVGDNEDPWLYVENVFQSPKKCLSGSLYKQITPDLQEAWKRITKNEKTLLKILSHFEITSENAEMLFAERNRHGICCSEEDIIKNPYLVYELTRNTIQPISLNTVDRGIFPDNIIRNKHPLPAPSALESATDKRRVRALTIKVLEDAVSNGHTLQSEEQIIQTIRDSSIEPACKVNNPIMRATQSIFSDLIDIVDFKGDEKAYQLHRFSKFGEKIRNTVLKRISGSRHSINADWTKLLNQQLGPMGKGDETEQRARAEKVAALKELAESRLSVLIGPAGTGKTTLISVLLKQKDIAQGGVLLLAPTGKARVRIQQIAQDIQADAYTIAQFLSDKDRYHGNTQTYSLSDQPPQIMEETVIIDESSMLTEDMLAAVFDALKGVKRYIIVGDHRQLPPIGAGRPFVDIINKLQPKNAEGLFPKVSSGYAELTIKRRQTGYDRNDLQLAEWFSGNPLEPGEDEIFEKITINEGKLENLHIINWETPSSFHGLLENIIKDKLNLEGDNVEHKFDLSLGGTEHGNYVYFNSGAGRRIEEWQILTPVRRQYYGVTELNRFIHEKFRIHWIELANERYQKIPKPMGEEQIVYGDKVINIRNHYRKYVWPKEDSCFYIANGEIGIVIGQFKNKNIKSPWALKIEFSTQSGFQYDFTTSDFKEESDKYLELAYALTVHKAQGSEFGKIFLIIPHNCHLLSRELLYTALTRQQQEIILLYQGSLSDLKKYASDLYSETSKRLTNLFFTPSPVEIKGKMYEVNLIHRTCTGIPVRSKSEVIIYDRLNAHGLQPEYEQPLKIGEIQKYPDFTIEDEDSGVIYYWEHCGMMYDPRYCDRWERKKAWYFENKILPWEDGGGENGTLIITQDDQKGGISSDKIDALIKKIFS